MKELFLDAEIEIIRFEAIDVITTSDELGEDELPPIWEDLT